MPSPFNDRRTRAQCGRAAERQRTVTLPGDSAAWNGTARRSVPRAVLATVSLLKYLSGEVAGVFAAEAALSFLRGVVQRPCRGPHDVHGDGPGVV